MTCALRVCPLPAQPGALRGLRRPKPAFHDVRHLSAAASSNGSGRKREAVSCGSGAGSGSGGRGDPGLESSSVNDSLNDRWMVSHGKATL